MTEDEGPSIPHKEKVVSSMQDKATMPEYIQEMSNTENMTEVELKRAVGRDSYSPCNP